MARDNSAQTRRVYCKLFIVASGDRRLLSVALKQGLESKSRQLHRLLGFEIETLVNDALASNPSFVHRVNTTNSDANQTKLQDGDELVEVNNRDVSGFNYGRLVDFLHDEIYNVQSSPDEPSREIALNLVVRRIQAELFDLDNNCPNEEDKRTDGFLTNQELVEQNKLKFWILLRRAVCLLIAAGILVLCAIMVILIYLNPTCSPTPYQSWWRKAIVYRVDLDELNRSYNSSDLKFNHDSVFSILEKNLNYFKVLQVGALLLSTPLNLSLGFTDLNTNYGSPAEFRSLINSYHNDGIKILIEFAPNYVQDGHAWFTRARDQLENTSTTKRDYVDRFIWRDRPNNWIGANGKSAWSKLQEANKEVYYLAQYGPDKPDLNYRNPFVYQYLLDSIDFWLNEGVDGFKLSTISRLFEDDLNFEYQTNASSASKHQQHRFETFHLIAEIKRRLEIFESNVSEAKNSSSSYYRQSNETSSVLLLKDDNILILDHEDLADCNTGDGNLCVWKPSTYTQYYGGSGFDGFNLIENNVVAPYSVTLEDKTTNQQENSDLSRLASNLELTLGLLNNKSSAYFWTCDSEKDPLNEELVLSTIAFLPGSLLVHLNKQEAEYFIKTRVGDKNEEFTSPKTELLKLRNSIRASQDGNFKYKLKLDQLFYERNLNLDDSVYVFSSFNSSDSVKLQDAISSDFPLLSRRDLCIEQIHNRNQKGSGIATTSSSSGCDLEKSKLKIPSWTSVVMRWKYREPDLRDLL